MGLAVFIIHDVGQGLWYPLCVRCIGDTHDPVATRDAIVARADDAHCVECDYHRSCPPSCEARVGLEAVSRVSQILASHYPIVPAELEED